MVAEAAAIAHRRLQPRYGAPRIRNASCGWAVCALGKFGGRELGFASDLELIFVYQDDGETAGREVVANASYFG